MTHGTPSDSTRVSVLQATGLSGRPAASPVSRRKPKEHSALRCACR